MDARFDRALDSIRRTLGSKSFHDPDVAQLQARHLVDRMALVLQASLLLQSENEEGENASSKSVLYTSRKIYGFVNQSTDFYLPDT